MRHLFTVQVLIPAGVVISLWLLYGIASVLSEWLGGPNFMAERDKRRAERDKRRRK